MKIKFILLFTAIFLNLKLFAQRDTIPINTNWKFAVDLKGVGITQNWSTKDLPEAISVNLPHTWNVETATQNHYGWGWYSYTLKVPANWKNKNVILQFGAINHTSKIYVNGKQIAENIGDGFNQIKVNLNGEINYGKSNVITVAVNNDYSEKKVPFSNSFDWANDGGIIRKVALIVSGKPTANYIHVEPKLDLTNNNGHLKIKLGFDKPAGNLQYEVKITEDNQTTHNTVFSKILKPSWQGNEAITEVDLAKVNPWHFDFPNLYKVQVKVMLGNKAVDEVTTSIGFKDLQMKEGQIFLNGEPVKLMGTEWTAGSDPNYGFAEPDSIIIKHCKMLKAVNSIFTRMHFQQDELFYDFCDRNGILVQQEIPLWGPETPASADVNKIALQQLERMVNNFYNHSSIFSWAVGNELRGRDADVKEMIAGLMKRTADLDKTRMKAYVSNTLTSSFINHKNFVPDGASQGDYLMMNEYGGSWWQVPIAKISNYLDSIHMSYPDKPLIISEFGLCEPNFKGGDERRINDLVYHMAVFESKAFVQGAIYFDLTDYRTHYPGTSDTTKFKRRIHGVYDMYGKAKPSMKVLRELSSPLEVQVANVLNPEKKAPIPVTIFGSIGLPQHIVKGYKIYVSSRTDNWITQKPQDLPTLNPGQEIKMKLEKDYEGKAVITVVRPNGYVASQQEL
ncbi:glycoside hydrolase family 2 protein [Pedobacter psychrodurus]|uniref:glycoside hydrolase family 2 protein n=1 Tax=Pedobacter psychrodurus TaxID=2530456 RepID=UPI00292CF351|nr:sugar-binding domain-containing protein [Pedobacter psychrodurus]